jgi:hypothetical protein
MILVSPAYVLAFLIASIYGLGFFLVLGRSWRELGLFWASAIVGFFIGQAAARALGLAFFNIGLVHVAEGTLGSALGLIAAKTWSG